MLEKHAGIIAAFFDKTLRFVEIQNNRFRTKNIDGLGKLPVQVRWCYL
jgi:hypothetical protein